jgi:hypothetical protein
VSESEYAAVPAPPELPLAAGVYLFRDGENMVHLADVDSVRGEIVKVRFIDSREEAFDVLRSIGGNTASLEAILSADSDPEPQ